jgi:hypothetical protein
MYQKGGWTFVDFVLQEIRLLLENAYQEECEQNIILF